mmetsp:Transcript_39263/g.65162  ORF Transcript_39263/g.65162 Transcript_39263/m.65162 type:complete len:179 (+) Transcript_39263:37-573(+)
MVFSVGKGRPPKETSESGSVNWDDNAMCFVGSNKMFWHGRINGGWKSQKPPKKAKVDERADKRQKEDAILKGQKMDKKLGVKKKKKVKAAASADLTRAPDEEVSAADGEKEMVPALVAIKPKSAKGRVPRAEGCVVTYDLEESCFKTDEDPPRYWHGSKISGGLGWASHVPKPYTSVD